MRNHPPQPGSLLRLSLAGSLPVPASLPRHRSHAARVSPAGARERAPTIALPGCGTAGDDRTPQAFRLAPAGGPDRDLAVAAWIGRAATFTGIAFYRPILVRVGDADLSVALASPVLLTC